MLRPILPPYVATRGTPDDTFAYLYEACFTGAVFSTVIWLTNRNSDLSQLILRVLGPFLRRLKSLNNSKRKNGDS